MNFRERNQQTKEITSHYEHILHSYGFRNIDVNISLASVSLKEIEANFWDKQYGYDLKIRCYAENAGIWDAVGTCDEIISFCSDPTSLQLFDLSKDLSQFLINRSFCDIRVVSFSNANLGYMVAFKDNNKYIISINRKNPEIIQQIFSNKDDPAEFSAADINQYQKNFDQLLQEIAPTSEYHIKLNSSLDELSVMVCENLEKYYLKIQCDVNLTWDVEKYFYEIIRFWYDSLNVPNYFLQCLRREDFRISESSSDEDFLIFHKKEYSFRVKRSSERIIDFDYMEGHVFEHFCAEVLTLNGYENVTVTQGSGDQGIDIIAYKDNAKYGIQCKCYSTDIGNKAVQEVFAGKTYYHCHLGVVLTNRYFTKSAIQLANSNGVVLWNRNKLTEMVEKCKDQLLGSYGK